MSYLCRQQTSLGQYNGADDNEAGDLWATPPWPGLMFPADSDEGKLLLHTPNGKGVAWLLINHKEPFGLKTISAVQIWDASPDRRRSKPCMLFYID